MLADVMHALRAPMGRLKRQAGRQFGRSDRRIVARYLRNAAEPKLHIGCGHNRMSDWLNTDHHPTSSDVVHLDATQPFSFADETFDYVFCEHMIEHISHSEGQSMLFECFRVLKKGGTLRISTPDLAFLIDLTRKEKSEIQLEYIKWSAATFVPGAPDDNETFVINNFFRDWGHTFIYDEDTLFDALIRAGFSSIVRCELQESVHPRLRHLENEARMPQGFLALESLTLEGTKRGSG